MTTTIEQTGKAWKATQALGGIVALAGLALMIAAALFRWHFPSHDLYGMPVVWSVTGFGVAVVAAGRVGAWWHHG